MNGWIGLQGLKLICHLGATEEERARPQEVVIDIAMYVKLPAEDALEAAVDYQTVADGCSKIVRDRSFCLIETLAEALVRDIGNDSRVQKIRLRLEKPEAMTAASCSFVELET